MTEDLLERPRPGQYELSHLRVLEAEAIHIIREVAAEFERPVLLFSGAGLDRHAAPGDQGVRPGRLPFPVMHVDTGHNFDEVIATRDELVARHGLRLVVASVQDDIDAGRVVDNGPSRNPLQTVTLLRAIRENKFDAAFMAPGATRRRPGPRSGCSASATSSASGTRRRSGPSCGTSTTAGTARVKHPVFPLSNWTEYDIWAYIGAEDIPLPAIYYAHPPGVPARRNAAGGARIHAAVRRRGGVRDVGAVPHRRRCDLHRLRRVHRGHRRAGDRRDRPCRG